MPRDVTISLHVTQELKDRLMEAAFRADRSVNDLINHRLGLALDLEDAGFIFRKDRARNKIQNESE